MEERKRGRSIVEEKMKFRRPGKSDRHFVWGG
jgi:hypothetical protein